MNFFNQINQTFILFFAVLFFNNTVQAQDIYIPDPHFKAILVSDPSINTNNDSDIQKSEAIGFSGVLDISNRGVYDLTGIEYFYKLKILICNNNQIRNIDLANNPDLSELYCNNNQIQSLAVSKCSNLLVLSCNDNQLTNLDLNSNFNLETLLCNKNLLTSLSLINNTNLQNLDCSMNQLTSLNLSNNPNLVTVFCANNGLLNLNLANNNNTNILSGNFQATGNNLSCILVDDPAYSNANWSAQIDPNAFFSDNCASVVMKNVSIMNILNVYPNPTSGQFTISFGENYDHVTVEVHNVLGNLMLKKQYKDVTGVTIELEGAAGLYSVTVRSKDQKASSMQVVKE